MLAWSITAALAHDPYGELARRPLFRDGELIGAWTSSGLVSAVEGGWQRRCRESFGEVADVAVAADGLLLATAEGVSVTDGACATRPGPAVGAIGAFATWGGDLVALPEAEEDRVWRSVDGGASFEPVDVAVPTLFGSAATDADGALLLAGRRAGFPVVVRLVEGVPPQDLPPPDVDALELRVTGDGPDGRVLVAGLHLDGTTALWTWDGAAWTRALDLPLGATSSGCLAGRCLVALDGLAVVAWGPADPVPSLVDGASACVVREGGTLWGCAARGDDHLLARSDDGVTWTPVLDPAEAIEAPCADDACPPAPPATGTTTEDTGGGVALQPRSCGCDSAARDPWLAGLALAATAGGRRRRSRAPGSARAAGAG